MSDLLKKTKTPQNKATKPAKSSSASDSYDAADIEVLEGLEPCLLYTSPSPRDRG